MTQAIAWLFSSGRIADVILAMIAIEAVVLMLLKYWRGIGPRVSVTLVTVVSGALLILAVRGALMGAAWPVVAVPLTLSMVAHFTFLAIVWRSDRSGG